jgi:hypothetical protein
MCGGQYTAAQAAAQQQAQCLGYTHKPEQRIADIISKESGVYLNPTVIRLIVKYNWRELAKAAHEIHDAR